mgnify:FL=1
MSVEMNFYLSNSDYNKLRLLKRSDREEGKTYNDYAVELLSEAIQRRYREYDRNDLIIHREDD